MPSTWQALNKYLLNKWLRRYSTNIVDYSQLPSSLLTSTDKGWTSPALTVPVCFQLWASKAWTQEKAAREFLVKCLFPNKRKEAWSAPALCLSLLNAERWEYLFRICSFSLPFYKVWNRIILSPHHLIICSFPRHGSWTSCLSFSSPRGRDHFATVCPLIQHLFSEYPLQWLLGSTDQKQGCVGRSREVGKEWWRAGWCLGNLGIWPGEPARRDFRDWSRKEEPLSGHKATGATRTFLIKPSLLWLQALALGLPPLGAVFLAITHTSGRSKVGVNSFRCFVHNANVINHVYGGL